jgi:opacity protein-like surface antigen
MRKFLMAAVMMLGAAQGAQAADMPDFPVLRGAFPEGLSSSQVNWQGYYIGAQAGYGSTDENFTGATNTQIARLLALTTIEREYHVSQWPLMGKESQRSTSFGGFAGYNSQWDDVVIGLEFSYMHGKSGGASSGSFGRSFNTSDGYNNNVITSSTASINISDFATLRARAGYAVNNFLPYIFGGFALGKADIVRQSSVYAQGTYIGSNVPPLPDYGPNTDTVSDVQHNHLLYGYSAGFGVDVNLIGGLFLRAEYEYLRFTSTIDTSINTGRVGLGYKF